VHGSTIVRMQVTWRDTSRAGRREIAEQSRVAQEGTEVPKSARERDQGNVLTSGEEKLSAARSWAVRGTELFFAWGASQEKRTGPPGQGRVTLVIDWG